MAEKACSEIRLALEEAAQEQAHENEAAFAYLLWSSEAIVVF